jgi:hypothetical protein
MSDFVEQRGRSGSASVSPIHSPRRWRQTWRPTSGKRRLKASPPRSFSEVAPLIRVRSLPPGRPSGDHPRTAEPRERPSQTVRPRGVHRGGSDRALGRREFSPELRGSRKPETPSGVGPCFLRPRVSLPRRRNRLPRNLFR